MEGHPFQMSDKIKITWEASDGYAGGSAPQCLNVNTEDYEGLTLEQITDQLHEEIQADFEEKVSWTCKVSKYAEQIHAALNQPE